MDAASSANAENAAEPSAEAYRYFSDEAEFATDLAKEGKSAYSIFGCMIEPYLIQARQGLWNEILADYSTDKGKDLSQHERKEKAWTSSTLVYGEVAFPSFAQYLWLLYSPELTGGKYAPPPRNGGVFVDLGSGTGRALIAAALLHDFDKIVGVELLSGLHQAAVNVVKVSRLVCSDDLSILGCVLCSDVSVFLPLLSHFQLKLTPLLLLPLLRIPLTTCSSPVCRSSTQRLPKALWLQEMSR